MTEALTYQRPWLYEKQSEAFFTDHRYSITEASTKAGKTVGAMAWLTEKALLTGREGREYWWVAPTLGQAKIAYRRIKRGLPDELFISNDTELTILLPNLAIMRFKTGEKPDALYGEDVYAAVIDEGSRVREESWHAIRSTLTATKGPLRVIGNVKGRKNWHYRLARKAESEQGKPGSQYQYTRITAWDAVKAGILEREEIEDAEEVLPEAVFRQLYLTEPTDDQGNPFGFDAIRACVIDGLSDLEPVVFGWDLAKSTDWVVGIGLDENGDVCRFHRWQGSWRKTIRRIRTLTEGVPALVDSTGVGDPVLEDLQSGEMPEPEEDEGEETDPADELGSNFEGFKFTGQSKQQLMEGLAVAIQTQRIGYPDNEIRGELDEFEYVYTRTGVKYSAPEGLHDDCVVSLGLAVAMLSRPGPSMALV